MWLALSEQDKMESLNLNSFEKITPTTGRKNPVFGLAKSGYFRINSAFKKKYNLSGKIAVDIRAKKQDGKIIAVLEFLDKSIEGSFSVSHYERNNSATFSGRSLFSQLDTDYTNIGKLKNLKPKIVEQEGKTLFVIDIPIKR